MANDSGLKDSAASEADESEFGSGRASLPDFITPDTFSDWFSLTAQDWRVLSRKQSLKSLQLPQNLADKTAINEALLQKLRSEPDFVIPLDQAIESLHSGIKSQTKQLTHQLFSNLLDRLSAESRNKVKKIAGSPEQIYDFLAENFEDYAELFSWQYHLHQIKRDAKNSAKSASPSSPAHPGLSGNNLAKLGDRLDAIIEMAGAAIDANKIAAFEADLGAAVEAIHGLLAQKQNAAFDAHFTQLDKDLQQLLPSAPPKNTQEINKILALLSELREEFSVTALRAIHNEAKDLKLDFESFGQVQAEINNLQTQIAEATKRSEYGKIKGLADDLAHWADDLARADKDIAETFKTIHGIMDKARHEAAPPSPDSETVAAQDAPAPTQAQKAAETEALLAVALADIENLEQQLAEEKEKNHKLQAQAENSKHASNPAPATTDEVLYPSKLTEEELQRFAAKYLAGKVELHPNAFSLPNKVQYKDPEKLYRALLVLRDYYYPMNLSGAGENNKNLPKAWKDAYTELSLTEKNSPYDARFPNERLLQNKSLINHDTDAGLNIYFAWDADKKIVKVRSLPKNLTVP